MFTKALRFGITFFIKTAITMAFFSSTASASRGFLPPETAEKSFVSCGLNFTGRQIYDTYSKGNTRYRYGEEMHMWPYEGFMFRDDADKTYVARYKTESVDLHGNGIEVYGHFFYIKEIGPDMPDLIRIEVAKVLVPPFDSKQKEEVKQMKARLSRMDEGADLYFSGEFWVTLDELADLIEEAENLFDIYQSYKVRKELLNKGLRPRQMIPTFEPYLRGECQPHKPVE